MVRALVLVAQLLHCCHGGFAKPVGTHERVVIHQAGSSAEAIKNKVLNSSQADLKVVVHPCAKSKV